MEQSQLLAHCGSPKITREELKVIPTPAGSATHQPLPHFEIVGALVETLSFRQISVVREEYAVSGDSMKMFGVLDLETTFDGCRFPRSAAAPLARHRVCAGSEGRRL